MTAVDDNPVVVPALGIVVDAKTEAPIGMRAAAGFAF